MSSLLERSLFVAIFGLVACGSESEAGSADLSGVSSKNGAFSATFTPSPNPPVTGENSLGIALADAKGAAVSGAEIEIEPWMPAHGHGSSTKPVVTELGEGKYRADSVTFTMPGTWELKIDVEASSVADSFVVTYDVK